MRYEKPTVIDLGSISDYVYGVPGGKEKEDVPVHIDNTPFGSECSGASGGPLTLEECQAQLS